MIGSAVGYTKNIDWDMVLREVVVFLIFQPHVLPGQRSAAEAEILGEHVQAKQKLPMFFLHCGSAAEFTG